MIIYQICEVNCAGLIRQRFVFLMDLVVIVSGLVLLHKSRRGARDGLLQMTGHVLIRGGIATALCTGYYWFKYQARGDFDRAYPIITHEMPEKMMEHQDMVQCSRTQPEMESRQQQDSADHGVHH